MAVNIKDNSQLEKDHMLMGIDLGTSTIKVGVFDLEGSTQAYQSAEYDLAYIGKDMVENDVEKYWKTLAALIRKTIEANKIRPEEITAVSVSSQAETIVPVDNDIRPLMNAIVWLDSRSSRQARDISEVFPPGDMYMVSGQPICDPSWPASRIKWLRENENDIYRKAYKFLLIQDYIIYRLAGLLYSEPTTYNSTYYYDINSHDFYQPMLDYLGVGRNKFPEIKNTGTIIGNISQEASSETGLSTSTRFVLGSLDQLAGAIGAGNIREGIITETTGSVFCMVVTTDKLLFDYEHGIPCYLHAIPGKYCLLPYSMTGGMVLKWFKDSFYRQEEKQTGEKIFELMTDEAGIVSPGSEGLVMIPHITGAYIPENNPDARGVFYGISISHNRAHFVRAIMESIGYMLKRDLEILDGTGIKADRIISMGGGAKSSLWNQIKADITGIEIQVPENTETAVLGAAIIAGVSTGVFDSFEQAVKKSVRIKDRYIPDKSNKKIYDAGFKKYKQIYKRLEDTF
jgi:xylulokinase